MRTVNANLPTLGNYDIHFFENSSLIFEFSKDYDHITKDELSRLDNIPHLGLASSVFTGINHTRLEYTLLQCAVIELSSKIHKDEDDIALSRGVRLNGLKKNASSGEELLKTWALLGAYGHCQLTYGVERTIAQIAYDSKKVSDWLLERIYENDLKEWARGIIQDYQFSKLHYLIALRRINSGPKYDRRKKILKNYFRNLVLPVKELFPSDIEARYKINRLRTLFERMRLLCIVTLDSYYSHDPIKVNLHSAITDITSFSNSPMRGNNTFEEKLRDIAGWLADELYLHPEVSSVQRTYETNSYQEYRNFLESHIGDDDKEEIALSTILDTSIEINQKSELKHLLRITFRRPEYLLLSNKNQYEIIQRLEKQIGIKDKVRIGLEVNEYRNVSHIDLLYDSEYSSSNDIAKSLLNLFEWSMRSLRGEAKRFVRKISTSNDEEELRELENRVINHRLKNERQIFNQIAKGIVNYILPIGWTSNIRNFLPEDESVKPILIALNKNDIQFNDIDYQIDKHLNENPRNLSKQDLYEIEALSRIVKRTNANLAIVCLEKFVICDQHGIDKDDWDGILLEVTEDGVFITIIEAKSGAGRVKRENDAFKQLDDTIRIILKKQNLRYRRRRLAGIGAKVRFKLDENSYY